MNNLQQLQDNLASVHVLYVEDEANVRDQTMLFLQKIFTVVQSASNGEEGLALFKEKPFHLVISDLKMPKMNGRDMLQAIHDINSETVLIVMTASDSHEDVSHIISDAYLYKPVMFTEFVQAFESLQEKLLKISK